MCCSKTYKRIVLLNDLSKVLIDPKIYETIDYRKKNEDFLKQFMYQPLLKTLSKHYKEKNIKSYKLQAENSLIWEGNKKTTLHNITCFNCQHRPDMEVNVDGLKIAIEIKKGNRGSDIRQGIGQCIIYHTNYDFIVFVFVDTSKDKKIVNSMTSKKEMNLCNSLWNNYNIMFKTV